MTWQAKWSPRGVGGGATYELDPVPGGGVDRGGLPAGARKRISGGGVQVFSAQPSRAISSAILNYWVGWVDGREPGSLKLPVTRLAAISVVSCTFHGCLMRCIISFDFIYFL